MLGVMVLSESFNMSPKSRQDGPSDIQIKPVENLYFDPENPRLPKQLQSASDAEVLRYMLLSGNVTDLMKSIGEKGYFQGEPLLVTPRPGKSGDGYCVVEGNRRLAALKLLATNDPSPVKQNEVARIREDAQQKPGSVPVLVFARRDDILDYLGYRHITGIKAWGPLAKARYLRQLRQRLGIDDDSEAHHALARTIGSTRPAVGKLLTSLGLLDHANDCGLLDQIGRTEDQIDFSLLYTGIGYQGIQQFIGLSSTSDVRLEHVDDDNFSEFFHWVFDDHNGSTVLGESRRFKELNKIVANAEALEAMRSGSGIEVAYLYTSGPAEALRQFIQQAMNAVEAAQNASNSVADVTQSDVDVAERLRNATRALWTTLKARITNPDDDEP